VKNFFEFIKFYIQNVRGETIVVAAGVIFFPSLFLAGYFFGPAGIMGVLISVVVIFVVTLLLIGAIHVYSTIVESLAKYKAKKDQEAARIVDRLKRGY
jgi:uncharacterized membrane protein